MSGTSNTLRALTLTVLMAAGAHAQDAKHYRFAYDQPRNTGYSIAADIFSDKLK